MAYQIGDIIEFICNGNGRGGHYSVSATITKIKRVTFDCTENPGSYYPGTRWNLRLDDPSISLRFCLWYSPSANSYTLRKRQIEHPIGLEEDAEPFKHFASKNWDSAVAFKNRILAADPVDLNKAGFGHTLFYVVNK